MSTNIKRIVIEDISNNTTELHVIFEAVVNSIQAQATKITCRFFSDSALKDENGDFSPRKITGMDICDNGHGFDDEDIASFKDYRTDKKIEYGCRCWTFLLLENLPFCKISVLSQRKKAGPFISA